MTYITLLFANLCGGRKSTTHVMTLALQMSAFDPKRTSLGPPSKQMGPRSQSRDKLRSVSCTGVLNSFQGARLTTERHEFPASTVASAHQVHIFGIARGASELHALSQDKKGSCRG